jgi:hypothetical protein
MNVDRASGVAVDVAPAAAGPEHGGPRFSVVIPAHDEERVIRRCLSFAADLTPGEAEIVVVANGCTDRTADLARQVPGVTVIESASAGKAAALNIGDRTATAFPRIYLDADIRIGARTLRRMATVLADDAPRVSNPRVVFCTEGRPMPVRLYYAAFRELPYIRSGLSGGVYALSRAGRARFGEFPPVTGDDLFVHRHFAAPEHVVVADETFEVQAPRTLAGLMAVRTRTAFGNRELESAVPDTGAFAPTTGGTARALARLVLRDPRMLPAAVVYIAVTLAARRRARRADGGRWHRDNSTR